MTDQQFEYIKAIWESWRAPVAQTGLIDIEKASWLAEVVIDGYVESMDNSRIATLLRSHGGTMKASEKRARQITSKARIGAAFHDALTDKGRLDPQRASRIIVSRVLGAGTWERDRRNCAALDPGWAVWFHRGPRCCQWAYDRDQHIFHGPVEVPAAACDADFCGCRAVAKPPLPPPPAPEPELPTAVAVILCILFVLGAVALSLLGKAMRHH